MKPKIAITLGDFNGIGPEIALKCALSPTVQKVAEPFIVGPFNLLKEYARLLKLKVNLEKKGSISSKSSRVISVYDCGDGVPTDIRFGKSTKASGRNAGIAIEQSVQLVQEGKADAMVTAPISKVALHDAGYHFPGQTEMIALFTGSTKVGMLFLSKILRVGLITVHQPLNTVSASLSQEKILEKTRIFHNSLQKDFGIRQPSIAFLGINPHAGENGLIGTEEKEYIIPSLESLRKEGFQIDGPLVPDGFFATRSYTNYDLTIAMYHDQGLIPFKLLAFNSGVNYSAGLSIIRTSPAHGTAYSLAGSGKAEPSSMIEALLTAGNIYQNRKKLKKP